MPDPNSSPQLQRFAVRYDQMPLAVYHEVAAHLESLLGLITTLEWNTSPTFRYTDSQIGALIIQYPETVDSANVEAILNYYGSWQRSQDLNDPVSDPDPCS